MFERRSRINCSQVFGCFVRQGSEKWFVNYSFCFGVLSSDFRFIYNLFMIEIEVDFFIWRVVMGMLYFLDFSVLFS